MHFSSNEDFFTWLASVSAVLVLIPFGLARTSLLRGPAFRLPAAIGLSVASMALSSAAVAWTWFVLAPLSYWLLLVGPVLAPMVVTFWLAAPSLAMHGLRRFRALRPGGSLTEMAFPLAAMVAYWAAGLCGCAAFLFSKSMDDLEPAGPVHAGAIWGAFAIVPVFMAAMARLTQPKRSAPDR